MAAQAPQSAHGPSSATTPSSPSGLLTRRDAIQRVAALFGGTLVGGSALLAACATVDRTRAPTLFSAAEVALLDEIADTLLPETATPGAKAAAVGPFMALMVADAYVASDQRIFRDGLAALEAECARINGAGFMDATPAQRLALLERLDREQYNYMRARPAGAPTHYFRMLKEVACLGYFTSEIGYMQAMRYVEVPGRFDACVPYAPGDKAWAAHA